MNRCPAGRVAFVVVMIVTAAAAIANMPPRTIKGDYDVQYRGTFRFDGQRTRTRGAGSAELERGRIEGRLRQGDEVTTFELRLNRPIDESDNRQRRRATGTFVSRENGRTTRGVGHADVLIQRMSDRRIVLNGTYQINWTRGRFAGGASSGRVSGRRVGE